jgi:hypothetical protein
MPPDVRPVAAGKSAAFRIFVRPVDRTAPFAEQQDKAHEAMAAAVRLLELAKRIENLVHAGGADGTP